MSEKPVERRVSANGVELAVYEWPGAEPTLLLIHANSFHARCWDPVVARLEGRRRIALDLRGHGQSEKPPLPYSWPDLADDLVALCDALELRGVVGVGHSLGGYALILAAALKPELFRSLLLLDPVVLPPDRYGSRLPGVHGAARRRNRWASPAALFERLHEREPFSRWEHAALQAYCSHGLLPAPDGDGFVLACPPEIEADIYHASREHSPYPAIAMLTQPVTVVRGHPYELNPATNLIASPTAPELAAQFANGRDIHLTQHSHFIPMENSALTAELIREQMEL